MAKSSALSKTLASLTQSLAAVADGAEFLQISVLELDPYPRQARTVFNQEALQELADEIKAIGIHTPLIVRPLPSGRYQIIAGERRFRAAKLAKLAEVPVLSKLISDEDAYKLHLSENLKRENLSQLELATRLLADYELAGKQLGPLVEQYGMPKPKLSKLLALAQGGDLMLGLINDGVTSNEAVLGDVSRLERKDRNAAKALVAQIRAEPKKALAVVEGFKKDSKSNTPKTSGKGNSSSSAARATVSREKRASSLEPAWRNEGLKNIGSAQLRIEVRMSPTSPFQAEFVNAVAEHGDAKLSTRYRHPKSGYCVVTFGDRNGVTHVYPATDLGFVSVYDSKDKHG
jgi:ParB family transcriptional regulator, chromosome partitioning protein